MKIDVDYDSKDRGLVLKEIYNRIGICMRDDTFEFNVLPKGAEGNAWHRINMQTREVEKEAPPSGKPVPTLGGTCGQTAGCRGQGAEGDEGDGGRATGTGGGDQ